MKKLMIPVAWVQISKAYVSFHLMGVYNDKAREGISKQLEAHMQGKTCFNFKVIDEGLFQELEVLTKRSCEGFRQSGFIE